MGFFDDLANLFRGIRPGSASQVPVKGPTTAPARPPPTIQPSPLPRLGPRLGEHEGSEITALLRMVFPNNEQESNYSLQKIYIYFSNGTRKLKQGQTAGSCMLLLLAKREGTQLQLQGYEKVYDRSCSNPFGSHFLIKDPVKGNILYDFIVTQEYSSSNGNIPTLPTPIPHLQSYQTQKRRR
jgi:hypothetical protein